jgi:hypothetical protein
MTRFSEEANPMGSRERIARTIEEFDGQGWHRTGTAVDNASGEWLRRRLEEAGVSASLETYPFVRRDVNDCYVEWAGGRLGALPMFDSGETPAAGINGRTGLPGTGTEVCLVTSHAGGPAPELEEARTAGGYKAIISVTTAGRPGLAPRNAESYGKPYGPPVLQVSSEHAAQMARLADASAEVTVVCQSSLLNVTASNVIGTAAGTDADLPPVVVMTPRSGWWQCASERGGGIAVWLEIARGVAAAGLPRTVLFVASTAHELGYWGLEQFLASRSGLAEGAQLWFHLGASVGAALKPQARLFASNDGLEALALKELGSASAPQVDVAVRGARPGGESRIIHDHGGRYVSLLGGSEVFHLEADRWPGAVSLEAVGAYAAACLCIVLASAKA